MSSARRSSASEDSIASRLVRWLMPSWYPSRRRLARPIRVPSPLPVNYGRCHRRRLVHRSVAAADHVPRRQSSPTHTVSLVEEDDPVDENAIISVINGIELRPGDFERLGPGKWLNGDLLDAYIFLCCTSYSDRDSRELVPLSQFFCSALLSHSKYSYSAMRRWTRRHDWSNASLVLTPVHVGYTAHWILAVIDLERLLITLFDSMVPAVTVAGSDVIPSPLVVKRLARFVSDEMYQRYGRARQSWSVRWNPEEHDIQSNSDDCGVHVCEMARRISASLPIEESINADLVRRRIRAELTGGAIQF